MSGPTIAPTGYWSADTAYLYHALSPGLAKWLAAMLDKSVPTYDFGCGMGGYLRALADAGHTSLVGFEGDPPRPGLWHVIHKADLTRPANTPGGPSLFTKKGNVLCIEVAEHVPAEHEATLYGGVTLRAKEMERETKRQQSKALYRAKFLDGPVLILQFRNMHVQFDPRNLQPLESAGTVYPTMRVSDDWGILDAKDGALMKPDWSAVIVVAPSAVTGSSLKGAGWALELKPGWKIVPGPRKGDFKLAPGS